MNTFKLKNRVGWGREFHIDTGVRTYAGSGRAIVNNATCDIINRKPDRDEFYKNGWPTKVKIDGFASNPYLHVGDVIEYEFETDTLPTDPRLITNSFKVLVTDLRYENDPHDMFFGKAIIIESDGIKVKQRTWWNRFVRWFRRTF